MRSSSNPDKSELCHQTAKNAGVLYPFVSRLVCIRKGVGRVGLDRRSQNLTAARSLYCLVGVAEETAVVRSEELPMYIGVGTIVIIVIIVLIVLALRR